jgi:hypothetical protein
LDHQTYKFLWESPEAGNVPDSCIADPESTDRYWNILVEVDQARQYTGKCPEQG